MVPVLFTFYIQGVRKLQKNNSGAKRLIKTKTQGHITERSSDGPATKSPNNRSAVPGILRALTQPLPHETRTFPTFTTFHLATDRCIFNSNNRLCEKGSTKTRMTH